MPHVETPQEYRILGSYPHLAPVDVAIWSRFIAENPQRFLRVWYDFRIGDEDAGDPDVAPRTNENWWDLTYWRIDVVAEDAKKFYVIEVKPLANSKAIGQALSYAKIFEEDEKPGKPVVPVVLTDRLIATTARCAEHCGVELWTT